MPFTAFEGAAGTGKTYSLILRVAELAQQYCGTDQRVLGLTFMHGSRRRLAENFDAHPELRGRATASTIDSFASYLVRRWHDRAPPVDDFTDFDRVCDACGQLLELPEILRWVAQRFPVVAIDEAQELKPCRLRIAAALSEGVHLVVAADEFQCLDRDVDTTPFMDWLATGNLTRLDAVRRTDRAGLLNAGVALREGRAPVVGPGLEIRYVFTHQVKFTVGHALRAGNGTRALLYAPAAAPWAAEIVPRLVAGFRSDAQVIPPLPVEWDSPPRNEATQFAHWLVAEHEVVDSREAVARLKAADAAPIWACSVTSGIEFARRAHGVQGWSRAALTELCERKALVERAYGRGSARGIRAMSIQGAKNRQFRDVVVLWPPGVPGDAAYHRRLLYNAITRAESKCTVVVRTQNLLGRPPFG